MRGFWIPLVPKIFRIDLFAVFEHRKVQMRSRAHARAADTTDSRVLRDVLPGNTGDCAHVTIQRFVSRMMRHDDVISIG